MFTNNYFINYDNYGVHKLICICIKFYTGKIARHFKIRYIRHTTY